jgi:hypothetical protein
MTAHIPRRLAAAITLARVACLYGVFAGLKRVVPVTTLVRRAWRPARSRDRRAQARAVSAVARLRRLSSGGGRTDCLESALVLYRELSSAGADPCLVMGFTREDGGVIGHAWVEVEGIPVAEPSDAVMRFVRTLSFGDRGLPVGTGADRYEPAPSAAATARD